ncbi:MAG: hypothetical protein AB9897_06250 [Anaerolineaceae bacterium]
MNQQIPDRTKEYEAGKARLSWLFGLVAGLVYVIVLWGISAVKLSMINAIHPWAQLLLGILPVLILCCLAAWLSNRAKNAFLIVIIWVITGVLITWIATHISFEGLTWYYRIFDPQVAAIVNYPFNSGFSTRMVFALLFTGVISGIAGVFYNLLLENAFTASAIGGTVFAFVIWGAFFAGSAMTLNDMVERFLRDPLVAINQTIEYKLIDENTPFEADLARNLHITALISVTDLIHSPRRIILQGYNNSISMTIVAIDFSGTWVTCNVLNNSDSEPPVQMPIFCRRLK